VSPGTSHTSRLDARGHGNRAATAGLLVLAAHLASYAILLLITAALALTTAGVVTRWTLAKSQEHS
jgi:hypothetical protein